MIIAGGIFILFTVFYALGVAACVWQEQELSLPHERAVRMTFFVTILSLLLFILALAAFLQVDWNNLLTLT